MKTKEIISRQGRGRPRLFDREAALQRAMLVFWERGYEATSLDDLTETMGLSPSSLYATFGDKEKLFLAAIDHYQTHKAAYVTLILKQAPSARQALERLFEAAAHELTRSDQPRGCMVAISLTPCSQAAATVHGALADRRSAIRAALRGIIQRDIRAGRLSRGTKATELADFYVAVFQGMSIQARDGSSRAALLKIGRAAMRAWPGKR